MHTRMHTPGRAIKRVLLAVALGLAAAAPAGCAGSNTGGDVTLRDGRVQRRGFLQNDGAAIGGETTGWYLATGKDRSTWTEVDVTKVADVAQRLATRRVIATGRLEDRAYTTRGSVPTLVADVLVLDEDQPRELNAGNLPPPPSPTRK